VRAVNAGIDKVDRFTLVVDEVTLSGPAIWICALPGPIKLRVQVGLRPFEAFRRTELGVVRRAQLGEKLRSSL
jgi:hypothetical protein